MAWRAGSVRSFSGTAIVSGATLALCVAATSLAAPVQPVRLVWARAEGADACSPASDVRQLVSQRLGTDPFSNDAPRTVEAVVEHVGDTWVARIQVRDHRGRTIGSRELTSKAPDCQSIQAAAVLAIALVIDPNARIQPAASASSAPVAPLSAPAPMASSAPLLLPLISAAALPPAAPATLAPPAPVDSQPRSSAALTLYGGLAGSLVPGSSPAAALAADIPVASSLNVSARSLFVAESRAADERFAFGLSAFGLGVCHERAGAWTAGVCASAWLGSIWAVVHAIPPTHPGGRAFTALSLDPYARVQIVGPLHLEFAGDVFVPVVRRSFTVTGWPDPAWRQPSVAAAAFLGAGLHFR